MGYHVQPDDPQTPGKIIGTYIDGTTLYAGSGNFGQCNGENPGSARIVLNGPLGMGAYTSCHQTTELFDGYQATFFYDHPNLKWVGSDSLNAVNVPGVIKVGPTNVIPARVDLAAPNATWYRTSAKVYNQVVFYYEPGFPSESSYTGPIDVLACVP